MNERYKGNKTLTTSLEADLKRLSCYDCELAMIYANTAKEMGLPDYAVYGLVYAQGQHRGYFLGRTDKEPLTSGGEKERSNNNAE